MFWGTRKFIERVKVVFSRREPAQQVKSDPAFVWCLIGNIIDEHPIGSNPGSTTGTKHFSAGTKVYCTRAQWGDGYEKIKVIGRHKKSKRYVCMVMSAKFITSWRIQKVYRPYVLNVMSNDTYGWTSKEVDRATILQMLEWLPDRTVDINE